MTKSEAIVGKGETLALINIGSIKVVEKWNPRHDFGDIQQLAEDIKVNGMLEALKVRKNPEDGDIELVDGERRLRALFKLSEEKIKQSESGMDLENVPCSFVPANATAVDLLFIAKAANNSKPLSFVEEGELFVRLAEEHNISQSEIARRIGRTVKDVNQRTLFVKSASKEILTAVKKGEVNPTQAVALVKAAKNDPEAQKEALEEEKKNTVKSASGKAHKVTTRGKARAGLAETPKADKPKIDKSDEAGPYGRLKIKDMLVQAEIARKCGFLDVATGLKIAAGFHARMDEKGEWIDENAEGQKTAKTDTKPKKKDKKEPKPQVKLTFDGNGKVKKDQGGKVTEESTGEEVVLDGDQP